MQSTTSECDTNVLSDLLCQATSSDNPEDSILEVLSKIEGPWCFIFWYAEKKQLWFGRDAMGRHSLLWSLPCHSEGLILTSVATRQEMTSCRELPAAGVFTATVDNNIISMQLYPWNTRTMLELKSIYAEEDFPSNLQICINNSLISPYSLSNLEIPKENDNFLCAINNILSSPTLYEPAEIYDLLLKDEEIFERVQKLSTYLTASIDVRCKTQPQLCKACVSY